MKGAKKLPFRKTYLICQDNLDDLYKVIHKPRKMYTSFKSITIILYSNIKAQLSHHESLPLLYIV